MSKQKKCIECGNTFPLSCSLCPHCARPALYPNVEAARADEETEALLNRYETAIGAATARGCGDKVKEFEEALKASQAVTARNQGDLQRLATADNELYATYYELVDAQVRIPAGKKWDVLRKIADAAWFCGYEKDIRFAALSLDGMGLANYGDCSIIWREDMIAHRASVAEDNTTVFMKKHKIFAYEADTLPKGYRAMWEDRYMLCVAKLADRIAHDTRVDNHASILLESGAGTADDDFVEVHVWGPMTRCTMEKVVTTRPRGRRARAILAGLSAKLSAAGVTIEER